MPHETVHDSADLAILFHPATGRAGPPVVVFGSGGPAVRAGTQREFSGTMTALGRPWLYVIDKGASFYAAPGLVERITAAAEAMMAEAGANHIDTLGHSMGAFGAVAFATRLPVRSALAFAPRYSPDAGIVPDPRFGRILAPYRGRFPFPTLEAGLRAAGHAAVLYGDRGPDLRHHLRLYAQSGVIHRVLPGVGHDLPGLLRDRKQLFTLIRTGLGRDPAALDALLGEFGFQSPGHLRLRARLRHALANGPRLSRIVSARRIAP